MCYAILLNNSMFTNFMMFITKQNVKLINECRIYMLNDKVVLSGFNEVHTCSRIHG